MTEAYLSDKPSLNGVRLKLERAEEHLDHLETEVRAYIDRHPQAVTDKLEQQGDWFISRVVVSEEPDPRWGVVVGDVLHNTRTALDHLVWQLVLLAGNEPWRHNQFPIYTDPQKPPDRARLDAMLRGVASDHRAVIEELQPYLGGHIHRHVRAALRWLADLSNTDKHRFLHPTLSVLNPYEMTQIKVRCSRPIVAHRKNAGLLHHGAELLAVQTAPDAEVEMKGRVAHEVAFGHREVTVSLLDGIQQRVAGVVESFAPAFD